MRSTGGDWRDIFSNKIESSSAIPGDNADIPEEEDEDVRDERRRVGHMLEEEAKVII